MLQTILRRLLPGTGRHRACDNEPPQDAKTNDAAPATDTPQTEGRPAWPPTQGPTWPPAQDSAPTDTVPLGQIREPRIGPWYLDYWSNRLLREGARVF